MALFFSLKISILLQVTDLNPMTRESLTGIKNDSV